MRISRKLAVALAWRERAAPLPAGGAAASLVALILAALGATGPRRVIAAEAVRPPVVLEGGISVTVTTDQRVTLHGEAASVRDVVAEVCRQAGVELRGYPGPAYRYFGKLENVSLDDAFRSLLREESYALGLRAGSEPTASRVVWIRVLGGEAGGVVPAQAAALPVQNTAATGQGSTVATAEQAPAAVPAPATPMVPFLLPPKLLFEAFNTVNLDQLENGQRQVIASIADDPAARDHFLATDVQDLANLFRPYRDAAGTVKRLQSLAVDRQIQAKLNDVARALGEAR